MISVHPRRREKLVTRTTPVLLAVLTLGVAVAQEATGPTLDPSTWFRDTAALAVVVGIVVQFVKPMLGVTGSPVKILAIALGAILGVIGALLGILQGGIGAGVMFGLAAGVAAAGGKDFLKSSVGPTTSSGGSGSPTPPSSGTLPR